MINENSVRENPVVNLLYEGIASTKVLEVRKIKKVIGDVYVSIAEDGIENWIFREIKNVKVVLVHFEKNVHSVCNQKVV